MITEAIKKIKDEMGKNNNPYVKVVGDFLIKYVEANPGDADKIVNPEKSIIKSLDEMKRAAQKKIMGNCAVLTDEEGFVIVLKYFGIEKGTSPVVVVSERPKPIQREHEKKKSMDFDVNLEDFI